MKKLLTGVVIVLITAGMLNACSEMEDESPSSSSSEYTAPEYKDMPDLRHMSLEKAIATLHGEGWTDVEAVEKNDSTESTVGLDQTGYHIASQDPHNGKTGVSTDTHVRLTVHKDQTRTISNLVAVNDPWDKAFEKLRSAGLEKGCDYIYVGGAMGDYSQYYVKSVSDGDADNLPAIIVEDYRDKRRHEEQQQERDASGQEAHGGAFCSTEGDTAISDRSDNILTCQEASDGRLRWIS